MQLLLYEKGILCQDVHCFLLQIWEMQFSFNEAIKFCEEHSEDLITLDSSSAHQFVVCPPFESLYPVYKVLHRTPRSL